MQVERVPHVVRGKGECGLGGRTPHLLFGDAQLTLIEKKTLGNSWGEKRVSEMFGVVGEERKIGMLTWRVAAAPP